VREILENFIKERGISSECFVTLLNEEKNCATKPFADVFKKMNMKYFKKFSNIVVSLELESKIFSLLRNVFLLYF